MDSFSFVDSWDDGIHFAGLWHVDIVGPKINCFQRSLPQWHPGHLCYCPLLWELWLRMQIIGRESKRMGDFQGCGTQRVSPRSWSTQLVFWKQALDRNHWHMLLSVQPQGHILFWYEMCFLLCLTAKCTQAEGLWWRRLQVIRGWEHGGIPSLPYLCALCNRSCRFCFILLWKLPVTIISTLSTSFPR